MVSQEQEQEQEQEQGTGGLTAADLKELASQDLHPNLIDWDDD